MNRHATGEISISDVTADFAQINVQGPMARRLLESVTTADLSDEGFAFRTARYIEIGGVSVLCIRITYVGELGYELYVAADRAGDVYDTVVEAGKAVGARHAGLKALSSLRMEKGYRDYGHDMDNTDTIWELGLGFALDLATPFLGREAVLAQKEAGPPHRRLTQILIADPEPLMHHGEVVWRDGVAVGYVRAASYGFTLGGAVGLAMIEADRPVTKAYLDEGEWEVDIAGTRFGAQASLRPLYDPTMERVRG